MHIGRAALRLFLAMLIGAAVGAGFASFETVGYDFFKARGFELLILRSVLAIGGHVSWAAIEAGALVMVKGEERLGLKHFSNPQFLMYVAMTMTMHFVWNVELASDSAMIAKYALLCAVAVYVSFVLINKAIAQVLQVADAADAAKRLSGNQQQDAQQDNNQKSSDEQNQIDNTANEKKQSKPKRIAVLTVGLTGEQYYFEGESQFRIGRDPEACLVVLPADTPRVSRQHCELKFRSDGIYLMDIGSKFGTYWRSGERIPANQWVKVSEDFYAGLPSIMFSIGYEDG